MSKIDLFSEETLKQFEGFGLSKEDVWRLPKEELEALMNGRWTGLMELRIEDPTPSPSYSGGESSGGECSAGDSDKGTARI